MRSMLNRLCCILICLILPTQTLAQQGCDSNGKYVGFTSGSIDGIVDSGYSGLAETNPANCPLELRKIISGVMCLVQSVIAEGMFKVYCGLSHGWAPMVDICLLGWAIFLFMAIALGLTKLNTACVNLIKILCIYIIITSPQTSYVYVYTFFLNLLEGLSSYFVTASGTNVTAWDTVYDSMIGSRADRIGLVVIGIFMSVTDAGGMLSGFIFGSLATAIVAATRFFVLLITAVTNLGFLLMFISMFLCGYFFSKTKTHAERYLSTCVSTACVPVLALGFLYMLSPLQSFSSVYMLQSIQCLGAVDPVTKLCSGSNIFWIHMPGTPGGKYVIDWPFHMEIAWPRLETAGIGAAEAVRAIIGMIIPTTVLLLAYGAFVQHVRNSIPAIVKRLAVFKSHAKFSSGFSAAASSSLGATSSADGKKHGVSNIGDTGGDGSSGMSASSMAYHHIASVKSQFSDIKAQPGNYATNARNYARNGVFLAGGAAATGTALWGAASGSIRRARGALFAGSATAAPTSGGTSETVTMESSVAAPNFAGALRQRAPRKKWSLDDVIPGLDAMRRRLQFMDLATTYDNESDADQARRAQEAGAKRQQRNLFGTFRRKK